MTLEGSGTTAQSVLNVNKADGGKRKFILVETMPYAEDECYKYDEAKQECIPIEKLPEYKDMLKGKYEEMEIGELPPRIPFEKLQAYLEEDFATYEEDFYGYEISKLTPMVNVKTCICIAHDDEKDAHHALQLVVEDNVVVNQDKVDFYHHGAITVGKYGRGKTADLRMFVTDCYPQIISDNKFFLGNITNNRLWRLDDPEVINVIVNMIYYSIVREEYREFVKRNKESEGK